MEKRREARINIYGNVSGKMILSENIFIHDLSLSGIKFTSIKKLNTNSIYTIELTRDKNLQIRLKGEVVRSTLRREQIREGQDMPVYEVAMNFGSLNDDQKQSLESFVNRLKNK